MGVDRLRDVPGFAIDRVAAAAGSDPEVLRLGKIAATPMRDWGETNGDRFIRLVFSNEPASRLAGIGQRVRTALAG